MRLPTLVTLCMLLAAAPVAADLPATVAKVKPSIVAVGTFMALRGTQKQPRATGFVVGGRHAAPVDHVRTLLRKAGVKP